MQWNNEITVFPLHHFSVSCVHIRGCDFACQVPCFLSCGFQHAFAYASTSTSSPMHNTRAGTMVFHSEEHKKKVYRAAGLAAYRLLLGGRRRLLRANRTPYHNSVRSGNMLFRELMNTNSTARFHDMCRMSRQTFCALAQLLRLKGGLESSINCRRKVSVGEKLMMFVQCLCGLSVRKIAELFQHSFSTVSVAVNSTWRSWPSGLTDHPLLLAYSRKTHHLVRKLENLLWSTRISQ